MKCLRKVGSSSKTARTDAQVAKVKKVMDSDRCLTIGHRFSSNEAVQAATTKALNSILETDFQRAFDEWQTRRPNNKCIDAGGMYFEGY